MRRLAAILTLLAAPCAWADDQPATTPTRDVDIQYRLPGKPGGAEAGQRVRWEAATGRERIDPPSPGLHIIVDTRAHRLASVRDAEKVAMEIDSAQMQPAQGAPTAQYVRRGDGTVAGLACTDWQAGTAETAPLLCFTADGVLLRVSAEGRVVAEAVRVTYAPADPADFTIPPDYRRVVREPDNAAKDGKQ
jgi:hypothetical protein